MSGLHPVRLVPVGGRRAAERLAAGHERQGASSRATPILATQTHVPPSRSYEDTNYDENIIEGPVSFITPSALNLAAEHRAGAANNNIPAIVAAKNPLPAQALAGIKHVFYIVKENRTYDQVLGDLPQGNGDSTLTIFGQTVTPNLHALTQQFVLLDNFYDCAEVSGDGWNWSAAGIANEYVIKNVPNNYSNRPNNYNFEGTNDNYLTGGFPATDPNGQPNSPYWPHGAPAIPDVAQAAGSYIWDLAKSKGLSYRNYGFFVNSGIPGIAPDNYPAPKGLQPANHYTGGVFSTGTAGFTDPDFREFDTSYADSEGPAAGGAPYPLAAFGAFNAPSRFTEWNREFTAMLKADPSGATVPALEDHTSS